MNAKILPLILGLAIMGAIGSLYLRNSSQVAPSSVISLKNIRLEDFPNLDELQYRVELFKEWADRNDKRYNALEVPLRFAAWNRNYEFVQDHNAKNLSWTVEMNKFADLSTEEFSALYLGYLPPADLEDLSNDTEEPELGPDELSINWKTKGYVTSVKNQGQCGTCYSFSAAGALEALYKKKGHKLTSLSAQQINDCSKSYGNNGCNGGLMENAFRFTKDKGIQSESKYPYQGREGSCRSGYLFKNSGYKNAKGYSALTKAVKARPVSVAVQANQQAFQLYKGGVVSSGCGTSLDHAVLAVGYVSDYWIVKNQWGSSWGESGYIRIKRGSGNGVCGINMNPSYPT